LRGLAEYDAFYAIVERVFADLERRFSRFVVFDLHTYNHRRLGPQALPADPRYNPEVNLGTGTLDRNAGNQLWSVFSDLETLTSSVGDWTYERYRFRGYFTLDSSKVPHVRVRD